jgi:ketosteroid isomerase-like protein
MFDRGFVGFSSTQHERIRGLGALRKTFEYYLKRAPKLTYHIEQPHVAVNGGTAVASFYWTVQLGRGRRIHGRGTHVFTKQGKSWRVVHEHFSRAH